MPSTTDDPSTSPPLLAPLATLAPASAARTWMTAPHPSLPLVATASSDKTVRVYSLATFSLASTVAGGHKRSVRACAWKPAGNGNSGGMAESVLATGSFDASAGVWRRWEGGGGSGAGGTTGGGAMEVDVAAGDDEEEEDEEWRFSVILDGHESEIKSVAWSAGGQFLATCSRDKSVWVWEEVEDDNFETIAVLQEHEADVKCVVWHPAEDLLASASYDDTIRLYREDVDDWTAVACITGHEATVWCVDFEAVEVSGLRVEEEGGEGEGAALSEERKAERARWLQERVASGSRLVSCSDDLTVRVWKMKPKDGGAAQGAAGRNGMPSILRTSSIEEEWVQEAVLPRRHGRAIYSVSWSKKSGLIASTGSDGKIVVYKEQWRRESSDATVPRPADGDGAAEGQKEEAQPLTEWVVVAEVEGAHDVFEINHVTWALRRDKGRKSEDEEVIISTGDDGEAKLWTLP
ncbi:putative cytosolic iron-sulfur protein assembly protein ciao1 [Diplodia corticola]|uniref:Probable cytosolic iron-sulfur protein assembly protein 1 n=1 Tax=Diplodia corticola TaxID=236234 RepID=A0A1J9S0R9_9PEZI|nr:putative cytosolic iron-sulfur protein assembly protein ciao1 [Diplodia corticola]OJD33620.1 putative cytosolic iron-sulfur protein assembly protein ciao1 [Diplodia corticola]